AEDGIRDATVTGVQTCALPIFDQRWDMFSPDPAQADGWMLAPAKLADGGTYDLLTGGPVSTAPRWSDPLYTRWVKVFERIANSEIGRAACRGRGGNGGGGRGAT